GAHADNVRVPQQVNPVGEQEAQRRLRKRVEILGGELAIAHHDRLPVGDDLDAARRLVFETNLAGLLDIELASDATAVGADLDEIPDQLLHVREIGADLVDLSALAGSETGCGGWRGGRGVRRRSQTE